MGRNLAEMTEGACLALRSLASRDYARDNLKGAGGGGRGHTADVAEHRGSRACYFGKFGGCMGALVCVWSVLSPINPVCAPLPCATHSVDVSACRGDVHDMHE